MNKWVLYSLSAILVAALLVSESFHSRALAVVGAAMAIGGVVILITDPRTVESRHIGYRKIGITFLLGGIVFALLAMYRKFLM